MANLSKSQVTKDIIEELRKLRTAQSWLNPSLANSVTLASVKRLWTFSADYKSASGICSVNWIDMMDMSLNIAVPLWYGHHYLCLLSLWSPPRMRYAYNHFVGGWPSGLVRHSVLRDA